MGDNSKYTLLRDNYIYISHLDEGFKFWPLPVYPDSINDSMRSTFVESNALGRSAPMYSYSNSGPRTVQIQLKFHREMMNDACTGISNSKLGEGEDYVDNLIHALQSIAVPKYNLTNKAIEPPLVALRLGEEVFIKGIVNDSIGITYEKPILYNDRYAQITLSLTVTEVDPYDATTVFTNGSLRGRTQTFINWENGE